MHLVVGGDVCRPLALEPCDGFVRRELQVHVHLGLHRGERPVARVDAVQDRGNLVGVLVPAGLASASFGLVAGLGGGPSLRRSGCAPAAAG